MRSPYLMLFAIGLVAATVTVALRPSAKSIPSATESQAPPEAKTSKEQQATKTTAAPSQTLAKTAATAQKTVPAKTLPATTATHTDPADSSAPTKMASAPSTETRQPSNPLETEPAASPVAHAVQLGDDVRLPAALMPQTTTKRSPEVAAAVAAIGDRFYREIQEIAASENPNPATDTTVIHKSPATEQALKRANEEYRALLGDEAYNRTTIESHIEVKLPTGSSD
jgi:hypothetical protein